VQVQSAPNFAKFAWSCFDDEDNFEGHGGGEIGRESDISWFSVFQADVQLSCGYSSATPCYQTPVAVLRGSETGKDQPRFLWTLLPTTGLPSQRSTLLVRLPHPCTLTRVQFFCRPPIGGMFRGTFLTVHPHWRYPAFWSSGAWTFRPAGLNWSANHLRLLSP